MRWPRFIRVYDDTGRSVRLHYRYLAAIVVAILFIGLLVVYLPVAMTSTPNFCQNCHLMKQPYDQWQQSTHANVNCVKCHVEPGIMKTLEHKVLSYKEIFANFFGSGSMPEDVKLPTNASCEQCHTLDRVVSPSGDIKIPHRQHVEMQGLKCADCHFNVVHTASGATIGPPPMDVCYMCHDGKKAPNACSTCHVNPPKLSEAHPANALENHGKLAKDRIQDCRRCHSERSKFCENCHSKPPATHSAPAWRYEHKVEVAAKGRDVCYGCHQEDFCQTCHKVQHPPDWQSTHPQFAQGGGDPCMVCHSPGFCDKCHTAKGVTVKQ